MVNACKCTILLFYFSTWGYLVGFQNHALVIGFTTWLTRLIKHPSWDLIAHKTKSSGPKNLEMSWNDIKSWIPPKSHMKQNRKLENPSDLGLEDDVPVGSCWIVCLHFSTCQISSGLHQPEWVLKKKKTGITAKYKWPNPESMKKYQPPFVQGLYS